MILENMRVSAGLSRKFVADQIGVSRQTVYDWERNGKMPAADKAILLANLFNTTVEKLMEEENGKGKTE